MTRARLLLLTVALAGIGCSFLAPFGEESQPCEPNVTPEQECSPAFECIREGQPDGGICKRRDAGS